MRVIITGATGLIGSKLCSMLSARGDKVTALTRSRAKAALKLPRGIATAEWDFKSVSPALISLLSECDAVIHLAGENLYARRWNEEHKKNIYNSRVNSTRLITEAILKSPAPPAVFISSSAVGYYGMEALPPADEHSEFGTDFLANVTRDWEAACSPLESAGVRSVNIRTGIVLDKKEGALAKMLLPFKLFAGGPLGTGKQPFPWIHIDDICGLYIHALDNSTMKGAYNGAAPQQVTMEDFCVNLGKIMKRPSFMNVPPIALKILYGEGAEMLLKGRYVVPKRTLESGFKFKYASVDDALKNLL